MDKTAAERQAAFRKRMRARGYRLMQIWVDAEGFPARASEGADVVKSELTLSRFQEELLRLTTGADEAFAARLYGELAAHAQGIREVWDLARKAPLLFSIEEGEGEQRR